MYIPFEELPAWSRIWIYQASRPLSDQEAADIATRARHFVNTWTTHGQTLHASARVMHNQFLVLATNEDVASPSGCSLDASSQFIRDLEQHFNVDLFDRTKLIFMPENQPEMVRLSDLKARINEGTITAETPFFDNLIKTAAELETSWVKPAGKSWLSKYF